MPIESLTLHKLRPKGYENDAKMDSKMRDTYKMYAKMILKKHLEKGSNNVPKWEPNTLPSLTKCPNYTSEM